MKKIFLPLLFPLTVSMAIDFTMTPSGITAPIETNPTTEETTGSTPIATSTKTNPYLEEVTLPSCDASNPEVQFIRSNADWSTINRSDKRIFCVSPGDYRSLRHISLTSSGTAEKRRYIILNNGNDTHPGKLDKSQLANYGLRLEHASYWVIDRWSNFDDNLPKALELSNGSSYNIINRAFTDNIAQSILITDRSNNNTIQNSRFQNMAHPYRVADGVCISIMQWGADSYETKNIKIINNEIVNQGDGFQSVRGPRYSDGLLQDGNCEGLIIDSNDIYIDERIYTDGRGHYTPTGKYAYAEDAIDLKVGSENPNNPIIITNNHMWGSRESDRTNSLLSSHGGLIVIHYGVKYLKIKQNLFFDSLAGIGSGDNNRFPYSLSESEITDNLFVDIGLSNGVGGISGKVFYFADQNSQVMIKDNLLKDCRDQQALFWTTSNFSYLNNTTINQEKSNINTSSLWKNSSSSVLIPEENYTTEEALNLGYTNAYTFTTNTFTTSPKVISLENTLK